jgi:type I restriction enzyme, S subunit
LRILSGKNGQNMNRTLSEISEINPGLPLMPKDETEVSFIAMGDVSESGRIINSQSKKFKDVKSGFTRFYENDVLFAKITPCMENGKGALARNLKNKLGCGSTEFHVLRAKKNGDPQYIFQVTKFNIFRLKAEMQMTGSAGQQRVPTSFFDEFKIFIPDLPKQRRIAKILTTVDNVIEKTEQAIEKYKAIKKGMIHDLFTRGIDLKTGKLRPKFEDAPHLYKPSKLGPIPKDWDFPQINDLAVHVGSGITPTGGSNVYEKTGILFLRSQNIHFGKLLLSDVAYIKTFMHESMNRSKVFPFDVLLNITGASIGRCCFFPDKYIEANVNQHVCIIRIEESSINKAIYLSSFLSSNFGQNQIDKNNAGGNREGLNYQQIRKFHIPWPKIEKEIDLISEKILELGIKINKENLFLSKMHLIKQGLMQDLLTGKVEVEV